MPSTVTTCIDALIPCHRGLLGNGMSEFHIRIIYSKLPNTSQKRKTKGNLWSELTLSRYLLFARLLSRRYRTAVDPNCEYMMAVKVLPGLLFENGSSCWLSANCGNIVNAPGLVFQTSFSLVPSHGKRSRIFYEFEIENIKKLRRRLFKLLAIYNITSNTVNTIFSIDEKYRSQRNCVCCRNLRICTLDTDRTISGI